MIRIGAIVGSVIFGLACLVFAQEPVTKGAGELKKPETISRTASVRKALAERIEIPNEFTQPVKFAKVASYLKAKLDDRNQSLDILVNNTSFREVSGDAQDIEEMEVVLPAFCKTMTVQDVLTFVINKLPSTNGTFLIVNGRVEVLTREAASIRHRLNQGIAVEFRNVPLKAAIEELSERAGVTIMIDPRCAEMNKAVTLQSQNDTSLRGILSSWADMYDLKMLVDEHRVLLMPRADYMRNLRDQDEESQLLNKTNPQIEPRERTPANPGM